MSLAITQGWMTDILTLYVSEFASKGLKVGLFKNDYNPDDASETADFTAATFGGYDGFVDVDTWSAGGITWVPPRMTMPGPTATWTPDGTGSPELIYGYYVVDEDDVLIWAERNPLGPQWVGGTTTPYSIALSYSVRSEFHSTS